MNLRRIRFGVVLVAAVVVAVVIVWVSAGLSRVEWLPAPSTEQAGKPHPPNVASEGADQESKSKPAGIPELALKFSPEEFIKAAPNKAAALAALYEYTNDPDYLDALKQRASTDPRAAVLVALLMVRKQGIGESLGERLSMLRQARERFPYDPIIAVCLAGTEAQARNHEAALALLMGINNISQLKADSVERQKLMRELVVLDGGSSANALRQATEYEGSNSFAIATMVASLAKTIQSTSKMPLDKRIEASSGVAALAQAMNPEGNAFEVPGLLGLGLEKQALRSLPAEVEYGEAGKTVANRLEEIEAALKRAEHARNHVFPFLEKAKPEIVEGYLERREQYGTEAAVEWVEKIMAAQQ